MLCCSLFSALPLAMRRICFLGVARAGGLCFVEIVTFINKIAVILGVRAKKSRNENGGFDQLIGFLFPPIEPKNGYFVFKMSLY